MQDFNEEVKKIKEKRSKMEMSEEGKERIRRIIEARNSSFSDNKIIKYVPKRNRTYIFSQKIASIFICFLLLSSCAFAGEWKDLLTKIFYSEGVNIEYAVDNGYVQNIDMDYVESNGIRIKVDYLYLDDYYMYIAFDIDSEIEFDDIFLDKFEIFDEDNNIIFSNIEVFDNVFFQSQTKRMSKKNAIVIGKLNKLQDKFYNYDNFKIGINKIELFNNRESYNIDGTWDLNIKFSKDINYNDKEINYYIDSKDLVEDYEVSYKNNIISINLKIREEYKDDFCIDENNIYLEDINGEIYNINQNYKLKNGKIMFHFFIDNNTNIEMLKLNLKCNNEIVILYLKRIGSD